MKRYVWIVFFLGCAHHVPTPPPLREPAPIADWVEQLGAFLPQALECAEAHPGGAAVVVSVRIFGTGEFGIMTRGPRMETVGCVHDGDRVVHQAKVPMYPEEVAALPFVTLGPSMPSAERDCARIEPVRWGSQFVGWLTKQTCAPKKMNQPPETSATSVRFGREHDESFDVP